MTIHFDLTFRLNMIIECDRREMAEVKKKLLDMAEEVAER